MEMKTQAVTFKNPRLGHRVVGLLECFTGIWLMYRTYAATVNFAIGVKAWI